LLALALFGGNAFAQTVEVTGGQIHGATLEKGGAVFKGIPYAAPPVVDSRGREPMRVEPWKGIREATAFGAVCAQVPTPIVPNATELGSEDCLNLNIWTPEWPSISRTPVIVRIH